MDIHSPNNDDRIAYADGYFILNFIVGMIINWSGTQNGDGDCDSA